VSRANASLGTGYAVRKLKYVSNDTPPAEVYVLLLAEAIVARVASEASGERRAAASA